MALIEVSIEINAPSDNVWNVISDIDNEPKFWKGTKEIRNISKEGNAITREITIAFRDQKCMQKVVLYPKERIEVQFTKGIIDGTKKVNLTNQDGKTRVDVIWDIKLTGMMSMFTAMIKNHIKSGTSQALQKIKEEVER